MNNGWGDLIDREKEKYLPMYNDSYGWHIVDKLKRDEISYYKALSLYNEWRRVHLSSHTTKRPNIWLYMKLVIDEWSPEYEMLPEMARAAMVRGIMTADELRYIASMIKYNRPLRVACYEMIARTETTLPYYMARFKCAIREKIDALTSFVARLLGGNNG